MLQIKSVDYRYKDGKTVQSTRLPGYSGVSGLDAEQDAEDEGREADLEAVCVRISHHDNIIISISNNNNNNNNNAFQRMMS